MFLDPILLSSKQTSFLVTLCEEIFTTNLILFTFIYISYNKNFTDRYYLHRWGNNKTIW